MTFLDEFKKKKKTLKHGVLNLVQRALENRQDEGTVNQHSMPVQERSSSPVLSNWDSSEDEAPPTEDEVPSIEEELSSTEEEVPLPEERRRKNTNKKQKRLQKQCLPKHQDVESETTNMDVAVGRKMSLDLGPTSSHLSGSGQTCTSVSEHHQVNFHEPRELTHERHGRKDSSKHGPRASPDFPIWTVQQWSDSFGVVIKYKRQLSPISLTPSGEEAVKESEQLNILTDTQRPKRNYRKARPPLTPQHPICAEGLVSTKPEVVPENGHQSRRGRRPSEPKIDILPGFDEELPQYAQSVRRTRVSGHGAGETSEIDSASRSNVVEYCTSEEKEKSPRQRMTKRETSSRLNALRGTSSWSTRKVPPLVESDDDPLDGLDDLLSEFERIETDREKRRAVPRRTISSCRSTSSLQSWASVASSTNGSVRKMEPRERKKQRENLRRELEEMDLLLEELGGSE